jgi:hypothetical protein
MLNREKNTISDSKSIESVLESSHTHPSALVKRRPQYRTALGAAYSGDSVEMMRSMPDQSVDLVVTSPPYALHFKKEYGNVDKASYVEWFRPFGVEILRILKPKGSFVLNIGGSYNPGTPTRSLYHFKLLLMLCDELGFHLAQESLSDSHSSNSGPDVIMHFRFEFRELGAALIGAANPAIAPSDEARQPRFFSEACGRWILVCARNLAALHSQRSRACGRTGARSGGR